MNFIINTLIVIDGFSTLSYQYISAYSKNALFYLIYSLITAVKSKR